MSVDSGLANNTELNLNVEENHTEAGMVDKYDDIALHPFTMKSDRITFSLLLTPKARMNMLGPTS